MLVQLRTLIRTVHLSKRFVHVHLLVFRHSSILAHTVSAARRPMTLMTVPLSGGLAVGR